MLVQLNWLLKINDQLEMLPDMSSIKNTLRYLSLTYIELWAVLFDSIVFLRSFLQILTVYIENKEWDSDQFSKIEL